uniref:Tripartite motif containing 39 n=1 Tax=Terrapene triunguis TaxID=2587831 RepID=A0A674JQC0_9SAUR
MDCGHNFCQFCITEYYEKLEIEEEGVFCPQCRSKLKKEKSQTNRQLARMVENIQQLGIKSEDLKKQTLFCEDDGEVICLLCDKTQEHGSHTLVPIEDSREIKSLQEKFNFKMTWSLAMTGRNLLNILGEIMAPLKSMENFQTWTHNGTLEPKSQQRISSEFEKLQLLLNEEKKLFLQGLAEEERETLKKLNENVTKLSQQSFSLQQLITEMEEKCQQLVAELLQVGYTNVCVLLRSEQVRLQEPELSAAELKVVYRVPGVMEMLREFTVDMTLDPNTAQPNLVLSKDRKHVRYGDTRQDLPDNPERFDPCVCVLRAEGFTGGRHYWEVGVGDKTDWDLGVCRESVRRKGRVTYTPEDGYWAVWLGNGEYKALTSSWTSLPVSVGPSRMGIFLDYEAGEVLFYNVTDRSHLFTFTGTFSRTLCPYYSPGLAAGGENAALLIICPVPSEAGGNLCP